MEKINFNAGWTHYREGYETKAVIVNLPHDAMIYEDRIPKLKDGSFTGFFPSADYYYVKNLFGDEGFENKTIILEFEAIYHDSTIYLNGEIVGGRFYGYSNFYIDLTGKLRIGEDNEIKVFVHNSDVPNARWYPGAGIYRPVNLFIGEKEHIDLDGVKILTKSINPAVLALSVSATTADGAEIRTEITFDGKPVASCSGAQCEVVIPDAKLWDVDHPDLYQAKISLLREKLVLDEVQIRFGIRKIDWNASSGLLINGHSVKLRGGCVHHDNGVIGACGFPAAEYRKAKLMKAAGFNAIRSSHYPISKAMLDACDEIGLYIMDETFDTWQKNVGLKDYALVFDQDWEKDLSAMVLKDLNHPSVIMYSIGNEITDTAYDVGIALTEKMTRLCHDLDGSRPVTCGINLMLNVMTTMGIKINTESIFDSDDDQGSKKGGSILFNLLFAIGPLVIKLFASPRRADKVTKEAYAKLDIAGYNYGSHTYQKHLRQHPERLIIGTETIPGDIVKNWMMVKDDPRIIGDFMWTGWDYLGEVGAGIIDYEKTTGAFFKPYPGIAAGCGAIDLTGFRTTPSYLAAMIWGQYETPYIAVRPLIHSGKKAYFPLYRATDAIQSWSWQGFEGKRADIEVYSLGQSIELFQDGVSLGKKKLKGCLAKFKTVYQPGILEAVSYDAHGKEIGRSNLKSASDETVLTVRPETSSLKANGEDLAYIQVMVTDLEGIVKAAEEKAVRVTVEGAGTLLGVGSGNPRTTEQYTGNAFTTYYGRMIAVLRSKNEAGEIKVKFSAEGVEDEVISINVK